MQADSLPMFEAIKTTGSFPRSPVLFSEGKPAWGIFLLCDGRATLSICAENGKPLTLWVAGPGEVLGLGAALSNTPLEIRAELLDASQVVFVRRKELVKFLKEHPEVCMEAVRRLCRDLHRAYEPVRSIGMVHTRSSRNSERPRAIFA